MKSVNKVIKSCLNTDQSRTGDMKYDIIQAAGPIPTLDMSTLDLFSKLIQHK